MFVILQTEQTVRLDVMNLDCRIFILCKLTKLPPWSLNDKRLNSSCGRGHVNIVQRNKCLGNENCYYSRDRIFCIRMSAGKNSPLRGTKKFPFTLVLSAEIARPLSSSNSWS